MAINDPHFADAETFEALRIFVFRREGIVGYQEIQQTRPKDLMKAFRVTRR